MDYDPSTSPSLRNKIRSSACFTCCFRSSAVDDGYGHPPSLLRSSSTWVRWKTQELPEIKSRCQTLMARVGKHHHRRHQSASDFRYDPLSYALNFDEGNEDDDDGEVPGGVEEVRYRNFSSRLPASPPRKAAPSSVSVAYG